MRFDILTLFPEVCRAYCEESILGRAQRAGKLEIVVHNIRDYTKDKHGRVDDYPYGGGNGMVMQPQPVLDCIRAVRGERAAKVCYLSPKGERFTQQAAAQLSQMVFCSVDTMRGSISAFWTARWILSSRLEILC